MLIESMHAARFVFDWLSCARGTRGAERACWGATRGEGGINHFILEKKGVSINVLILVVYSAL